MMLGKLTREFHPNLNPHLPLLFLLIFPTAFFLNAVYTESLFLALSIATFYYAFRRNFVAAGILGALAALTRPPGVLLALPVVWEYASSYGWRNVLRPRFLPILLIPIATLSILTYHWIAFGDPLLLFKIEAWWGRHFTFNRDHFSLITHPAIINLALDLFFLVVGLIASYGIFRTLRPSYGIYILSAILLAVSSGTLMSIGRFLLVLFPIFIWLASLRNKTIQVGWAFVSTLLLALTITLFVNNYWAG